MIYFHQLNVSKLTSEINQIRELSNNQNNLLIGLEITIYNISKYLSFNIDPQHGMFDKDCLKRNTCVEKVQELIHFFKQFKNKNIYVYILKSDLDSISAAALFDIYLTDFTSLTSEMMERIKNIADYDRHGRNLTFNLKSSYKIPSGLFMFVSGWKNSIKKKIDVVKSWILTGKFDQMSYYNQIASKILNKSVNRSKIEIIIPKKLVYIRSINRGACGLGYRIAPVVMALNPSYCFGLGRTRIYGKKWIISQFNDNYLDMNNLLNEIQKYENNWGGSSTIIGSPQDQPSKLNKDIIIEVTKSNIIF